jgi:hypothetical protein
VSLVLLSEEYVIGIHFADLVLNLREKNKELVKIKAEEQQFNGVRVKK